MTGRLALGAVGVLVGLYGGYLLVWDRLDQLVGVAVWFAGGVAAHDFVLVPLTLLLVVALARIVPGRWRAPAAVAFVVLGTLTVVAVPFLGRFGALPDNPTLLDRDYTTGYAVLVAVVLVAVGLGELVRRRHPRSSGPGSSGDTP